MVLIIQESHFNIRIRCPKGFLFITRLELIESKSPRGGVTVFKNISYDFDIEKVSNFRDSVIMKIKSSDVIIASP